MARSSCPYCGLRSQHCRCRREASTTGNANGDNGERAFKLTVTSFCVIYLSTTLAYMGIFFLLPYILTTSSVVKGSCHLEVFVDSFSISNTSTANANATATADWNVSFVAKSQGNTCKISLHTIKSSLFRSDKLISESFTPDYFGKQVTGEIDEPLPHAVFKTVATPPDGGVVWDIRVNVVSSFRINGGLVSPDQGFLIVNCGGIPVNFTADPAGNMKGALLGYMRPCEYLFRNNYTDTTF